MKKKRTKILYVIFDRERTIDFTITQHPKLVTVRIVTYCEYNIYIYLLIVIIGMIMLIVLQCEYFEIQQGYIIWKHLAKETMQAFLVLKTNEL